MTDDEEEVDLSVSDSLLKPFLFDCIFHLLYHRVVRIARKVKKESERKNTDPLVLRDKLLVSLS